MALRQKIRLGDVLIKAGVITQEQLGQALEAQKKMNIPLGKALVQLKFVSEENLLTSLGKQLNMPYIDMNDVKIDQAAIKKVKENVAKKHNLIPIKIENGMLTIAMSDPLNIFAVDEVTIQSGLDVVVNIASDEDIDRAIQETGSPPERIIYIGDNYFADIVGAKNAGITPVLLDPGEIFPDAECSVIRSLGEIMEMLIS